MRKPQSMKYMPQDEGWCSATEAMMGMFLVAYEGSNICIRRPLKPPRMPVEMPTVMKRSKRTGMDMSEVTTVVLYEAGDNTFLSQVKMPQI